MFLEETAALMMSTDYKDRFKAEYYQLKIRTEKLEAMLNKWDKGELTFKPTCPREWYDIQLTAMKQYKSVLEERAKLEEIVLDK